MTKLPPHYLFDDESDKPDSLGTYVVSMYIDEAERVALEYLSGTRRPSLPTNVEVTLYLDDEAIKWRKISVPEGKSVAEAVNEMLPDFLSPGCLDRQIDEWEDRVEDTKTQLEMLKDMAKELGNGE